MLSSVMNGIRVHTNCGRPGGTIIFRRRTEDVNLAIAIVGPRDVEAPALRGSTRIDGNLREAVGARDGVDAEHRRRGINNIARGSER